MKIIILLELRKLNPNFRDECAVQINSNSYYFGSIESFYEFNA
jgi:hypothetical protein